jgi:hypothetical protein
MAAAANSMVLEAGAAEAAAGCVVRDLWAKQNYTASSLPAASKLVPHATELYRVWPAGGERVRS